VTEDHAHNDAEDHVTKQNHVVTEGGAHHGGRGHEIVDHTPKEHVTEGHAHHTTPDHVTSGHAHSDREDHVTKQDHVTTEGGAHHGGRDCDITDHAQKEHMTEGHAHHTTPDHVTSGHTHSDREDHVTKQDHVTTEGGTHHGGRDREITDHAQKENVTVGHAHHIRPDRVTTGHAHKEPVVSELLVQSSPRHRDDIPSQVVMHEFSSLFNVYTLFRTSLTKQSNLVDFKLIYAFFIKPR